MICPTNREQKIKKSDANDLIVDVLRQVHLYDEVKDRLNFELQNALDIDIQNIEMQTVDIDSTLSFDVSIK